MTIRMYTESGPEATTGYMLMPDGEQLNTLEPPWKNNKRNISCIPQGQYRIKRDKTGRHQWFSVQDVPDRFAIELHEGHHVNHSDGCILLSKPDLMTLLEWFGSKDWVLDIKRKL